MAGGGDGKKRGRAEVKKTPRPRKKPANVKKAAKAKRAARRSAGPASSGRAGEPTRPLDPSAADDAETRYLQPYQATKTYLCPGCNRDIPPGLGHLVAVPPAAPDLRRHWHRGCWANRHNLG